MDWYDQNTTPYTPQDATRRGGDGASNPGASGSHALTPLPVASGDAAWPIGQAGRGYRLYPIPSGDKEWKRLNFEHFVLLRALGNRLCLAPPFNAQNAQNVLLPLPHSWHGQGPATILDVGAGTGMWMREVAQRFPWADIVGLDLVLPPRDVQLLNIGNRRVAVDKAQPQCSYQQHDVLDGLPFPDGSFDYVHMRFIGLGIPSHAWSRLLAELVRVTAPGGFIEIVEAGPLAAKDSVPPFVAQAMECVSQALHVNQIDLRTHGSLGLMLAAQGELRDRWNQRPLLPVGQHGDRIGDLLARSITAWLEALVPYMLAQGVLAGDMIARLHTELLAQLQSSTCVLPLFVVCGQRAL